jgi:hypothetical protein
MTEKELAIIGSDEYMKSDFLTAREKAAVLWAEHVTLNTAKHRDDIFEIVAEQFSEAEIVELTMLCSFRNMRNRFHDSLQIDLDPPSGAESVGRGSQVDPAKLKDYLQVLIDNWPDEFPTAPER